MKSYIMFHCHSDYSLLDSATKYEEYIDLAVRDGSKALSISEHGKPMNWTEKWAACKRAGIKYIHSVEIYLTEQLEPKVRDNYHTVLMAKNIQGVLELNKLVGRSCDKEHFYYNNRISFDEFLSISNNIISTSACLASPLNRLDKSHPRYMELARKYDFLEVQPHDHPDQKRFNEALLDLSRKIGTPLIAGTDTHSSSQYKAECRSALMSAKGKSYGDEDSFDLTYKTYDELVAAFKKQDALPEEEYLKAIENTNQLFDMVDEIDLDTSIKYPILYGSRDEDKRRFRETVRELFKEKLRAGIIPKEQKEAFINSITEELRVFEKLEMSGFMLSMSELVRWCKKNNMAIGTARGSVGGSRVAYVTDIIDLNPETWNTIFSRFANEDRKEIGDIDIDCVETDRPKIFAHIIDRFGADKTARVASFGTLKSKGIMDDVGRHLARMWDKEHPEGGDNPWSLKNIDRIKKEFDEDSEKAKRKYQELFYYHDGLMDVKISQSVHPAGMVISPITLPDNYGVFDKDGETCLFLDMENIHDYTGLAKYDFLVLKTVQVIRDTCNYIGIPYPRTHEIDWEDQKVWESMRRDPTAIFQMEGDYAWQSLRKFAPKNIFDMSLVTACIRPTGASYRDDLLARKKRKNPSEMIDELLKNNLGYLVYQEDTIAFLQLICGLSGGEADTVRRAIGRKRKDILDNVMPRIIDGYCNKSPKPRDVSEEEVKEFIQILEDSASYQFGYNHSIAYCLLGYLCAYFRYYYPLEFITAFLNNAANDDDIKNGTAYAGKIGIEVSMPKWGLSRATYYFDKEKLIISKGVASIKSIGENVSEQLYALSKEVKCNTFYEVLDNIKNKTNANRRQIRILIGLDFFSMFGNQRKLLKVEEFYFDTLKAGTAKRIARERVDGTPLECVVAAYSNGETKSGGIAKSYVIVDIEQMMREAERVIMASDLQDFSSIDKARQYKEAMGYMGYVSGLDEDRKKLFVSKMIPLKGKNGKSISKYLILTRSIGSGKESRFIVQGSTIKQDPFREDDVIQLVKWERTGNNYFKLNGYRRIE